MMERPGGMTESDQRSKLREAEDAEDRLIRPPCGNNHQLSRGSLGCNIRERCDAVCRSSPCAWRGHCALDCSRQQVTSARFRYSYHVVFHLQPKQADCSGLTFLAVIWINRAGTPEQYEPSGSDFMWKSLILAFLLAPFVSACAHR